MLELKTSITEHILDIDLNGSLDSQSASDFKAWVLEKNVEGYNVFALNCQNLEFISSRGIGALTDAHKILKTREAILVMYNVSNEVLNLLEFLKIAGEVPIKDTLEEIEHEYKKLAKSPLEGESLEEELPEEADENLEDEELPDLSPPPVIPNLEEPESILTVPIPETRTVVPGPNKEPGPQKEVSAKPEKNENIIDEVVESVKLIAPKLKEEYIDLNNDPRLAEVTRENEVSSYVIFCPNCGESLRVKQRGQYLCPECRIKFHYPVE